MRKLGRYGVLGAAAVALAGWVSPLSGASAQNERHRVLVVPLNPKQGADDDFGKDFAKRLRELIDDSNTHQPVGEKELKDAAKQFDIDMEDIDCVIGVQLGSQMGANLVFCGQYTEDDQDKTVSLTGMKFQAPGGNSFGVDDAVWQEKQDEEAAAQVYGQFGSYIDQIRRAIFCDEYFKSRDWESAESNCGLALEMKPDDAHTRLVYAMLRMEKGREAEEAGDDAGAQAYFATSYADARTLLEQDPLHEDGLELAGFLAAKLNRPDEARGHYTEFLKLDPGNATVRMRVAYDLAVAGDAEGAMQLIETGLELDGENVDLLLQHASFAARAAQELRGDSPDEDAPLPPKAAELYEKVLSSYDKAYAALGEEMDVSHLRNMIAAYSELEQLDRAVSMTERVLRTHGRGAASEAQRLRGALQGASAADRPALQDSVAASEAEVKAEAALWFLYANILKRSGKLDEAVAALDTVGMRDGDYPNTKVTQGRWLLEADRPDQALPFFHASVEKGEQKADLVARILLGDGVQKGRRNSDYGYTIKLIEMAKTFEGEIAAEIVRGELDFWHGYALYERAKAVQDPETLQSAQQALPMFQSAARLLGLARVATYAEGTPTVRLQQLRDAIQQYIEIQQALIQRGA